MPFVAMRKGDPGSPAQGDSLLMVLTTQAAPSPKGSWACRLLELSAAATHRVSRSWQGLSSLGRDFWLHTQQKSSLGEEGEPYRVLFAPPRNYCSVLYMGLLWDISAGCQFLGCLMHLRVCTLRLFISYKQSVKGSGLHQALGRPLEFLFFTGL